MFTAVTDLPLPYRTEASRESFLQAARFIGREQELPQLESALQQCAQKQGSVWLIGGESGVGKSRLLDELRTRALVQGALVLCGQAQREGASPYLIWLPIVRWMVLLTDLTELEASVLKALIPDMDKLLQRKVPDAPPLNPQAGQERMFAIIEGILQRQQQPLVVLLEDLHWAGSESLALLAGLSPKVKKLPLLFLASYRSDAEKMKPNMDVRNASYGWKGARVPCSRFWWRHLARWR